MSPGKFPRPFVPRWWLALRDKLPHEPNRYMPIELDKDGHVSHAYPTRERIGVNPGVGVIVGVYWWEDGGLKFLVYDKYRAAAAIYQYGYDDE